MTKFAKEIAREINALPAMIAKCKEHFVPQVLRLMPGLRAAEHCEIVFCEAMSTGLRFELQIAIEGMVGHALATMMKRLDPLTRWEGKVAYDDGFTMNGLAFQIGDGDDYGALYIRDGKVCVWVRGFKTEADRHEHIVKMS